MSKARKDGEVRAIIGSGYLAGEKDLRDAGPIPKSAGVKVVRAAKSYAPSSSSKSAAKRTTKKRT